MIFVLFVILICLVSPATMLWGWIRWARNIKPKTLTAALALIGFALATLSALLAIGSLVYGQAIGGFPFYDPRLLRIYLWGCLLSLGGIVVSLGGVWRPSPLRWHAAACSLGTLIFWVVMAEGE